MNVQFYMKRFDEAALVFDAIEARKAPRLAIRHIRYHRELFEGDGAIIRAGWIKDASHSARRVQVMTNADTGNICTTALDTMSMPVDLPDAGFLARENEMDAAMPRGLDGGEIKHQPIAELLQDERAAVTHYSIVERNELNSDSHLHCNRIISRFTDGAPHIWNFGGLPTQWLQENNLGRVAVEMKVMPTAETSPGTALRLVSSIADRNEKTFRILHQLQEITSGKVIALGEVRCLIIDLEKRRVVDLPEAFLAS